MGSYGQLIGLGYFLASKCIKRQGTLTLAWVGDGNGRKVVGEYLSVRCVLGIHTEFYDCAVEYPVQGYKRVTTANHVSQLEIAAQVHTCVHAYCTCIPFQVERTAFTLHLQRLSVSGRAHRAYTGHTGHARLTLLAPRRRRFDLAAQLKNAECTAST